MSVHTRRHRQEAIQRAIDRAKGMSPEAQQRLDDFNEQCEDWRANCETCGAALRGSLTQLRAHQHEEATG